MEDFEFRSSSSFISEERFVVLRWNRSAGVTQYTLSCPNKDCQNETLNGNVDNALFKVFTRDEVNVTLTALYRCTANTSTAHVTVPAPATTAPITASTGISSIRCTYF